MPGTLMRDALALDLLAGATLNAAGTTNSTGGKIAKPGPCRVMIETGTVTGTTPTLQLTVVGADDAAFTVGVTKLAATPVTSGTGAAQTSLKWVLPVNIYKNYVRAIVVLGGTSPVYTGTTAFLRAEHDRESHQVGTVFVGESASN